MGKNDTQISIYVQYKCPTVGVQYIEPLRDIYFKSANIEVFSRRTANSICSCAHNLRNFNDV
jgi:hypothetical protein